MSKGSFFEDFNPVSAQEWEEKIKVDLKGADYDDTLIWESPEGIAVQPFYHSENHADSFKIEKAAKGWLIGQIIHVDSDEKANKQAQKAVKKGAESLRFVMTSAATNIRTLLKGINVEKIQVHLDVLCYSETFLKPVIEAIGYAKRFIHVHIDPIGNLVNTGNWASNFEKDISLISENSIYVDTSIYQNAGADIVQQLSYALSHANEYLNALSHKKRINKVYFKVAVGTNYFFEIAKLRALRMLWAVLAKAYNVEEYCHIIALPTRRNKTVYDYNTNMLRTTTECMSAVLGGADIICNTPYDSVYKKENEFGDRISLNQLLLLKNESYFDKVSNAADGAYYIEELTQQLAEKALVKFKSLEQNGGFIKSLELGVIQEEVKKSALEEEMRFNEGKAVLVGTNKYINEQDVMKGTVELELFKQSSIDKRYIEPIVSRRLAEVTEQNRLCNE